MDPISGEHWKTDYGLKQCSRGRREQERDGEGWRGMERMTGNEAEVEGQDVHMWGLQMRNKRLWEMGGGEEWNRKRWEMVKDLRRE